MKKLAVLLALSLLAAPALAGKLEEKTVEALLTVLDQMKAKNLPTGPENDLLELLARDGKYGGRKLILEIAQTEWSTENLSQWGFGASAEKVCEAIWSSSQVKCAHWLGPHSWASRSPSSANPSGGILHCMPASDSVRSRTRSMTA